MIPQVLNTPALRLIPVYFIGRQQAVAFAGFCQEGFTKATAFPVLQLQVVAPLLRDIVGRSRHL